MDETLFDKISSESSLRNAWDKIAKNEESHGYSGETIKKFKDNLDSKLPLISAELKSGRYKFSPNRAVVIPKSNGKLRPLQVPEIQDRVVLKAIALVLEEQFADLFAESKGISFAYQKKTGVRDAIERMLEIYYAGKLIFLEADIIDFFGSVNKESLLINDVFPKLSDDSLNPLISLGLNQQVIGLDKLSPDQAALFSGIDKGIPQGNPLSPLLSNIYLARFDKFISSKGFSLIRYADDFIVLCQTRSEAEFCYNLVKDFLFNELCLKVHPIEESNKTRIVDPRNDEFSFLSIGFDGTDIFPSIMNFQEHKEKLWNICHSKGNVDVLSVLTDIKYSLEGWISAFFYTKIERYADELDNHINRQILLSLKEFDWRFSRKTIGKMSYNKRKGKASGEMLSKKQRKHSGVPFCMDLVNKKRLSDVKIAIQSHGSPKVSVTD